MTFAFEKLQVYQNSVAFGDAVCATTRSFPRGYYFLADADSALGPTERAMRNEDNVAGTIEGYGLLLTYLGRKADAMRAGERAVSLVVDNVKAYQYNMEDWLARIYARVGEREKAITLFERLLTHSWYLTPGRVRLDPDFAPLRGDPRFERLIAQHVTTERPAD